MVTGVRAFPGDTPSAITRAITSRDPERAAQRNPQVPAVIDSVIARALDRTVSKRHQTATELLEDLRTARQALNYPLLAGASYPRRRRSRLVITSATRSSSSCKSSSRRTLESGVSPSDVQCCSVTYRSPRTL